MEKQKRKQAPQNPIGRVFSGLAWLIKSFFGLLWGIGRFALKGAWWIVKKAWKSGVWLIKQPYYLLRYIMNGRIPNFENSRQEEIFWRIKRQYRRKRLFALNSFAFVIASFIGIGAIISHYAHVQNRLMDSLYNPDYLWNNFNNTLASVSLTLAIWLLVLGFHTYFNRTGNEEDQALSEALEKDYARNDRPRREAYERLADAYIDEDEDYESKPKRNHVHP